MKKRIIFIVALGFIAFSANAEGIESYLNDQTDASVQIELITPPEVAVEQTGILGRLRALLGIRKTVRVKPPVGTKFIVQSSAYASSPYQTDSTPCTTAAGTRVRPGVVASNFLPLGTLLDINGEAYIVEDRMNSRYNGYFLDVWFPSTSSALQFGRKKMEITIKGYAEPGQSIREVATNDEEDNRELVDDDPGVWANVRESIALITTFLGARTGGDVNRFDVDCTNETPAPK